MRSLVLLLALFLGLAATLSPAAGGAVTTRRPVDDVGFPFWCDWGYDWDERCYRDFGPRLPVGGVDDKVWRSGLRFSLAGIPRDATIGFARLEVYFDRVCVAPRLLAASCPAEDYTLDAHRIWSADWYHEREPEFYAAVEDEGDVPGAASPQWFSWNLTALVADWMSGATANNGVLLSLAHWQEDFNVGGPYFASMSFPDAALRPRLVIGYLSPSGPAP